jgi:hypothetical protein
MKTLFKTLQLSLLALLIFPLSVLAAPVINVDLGNGRQSLCKPVGEVTVNEEYFNNDVSINIFPDDYIYVNNTTATVTIRAVAANTGDSNGNVNYSIKYNGTPGTLSTSHSFTVTVDGKTQPITVNTSPEMTKIDQMDTYTLTRFAKGVPGSNEVVYNESEIPKIDTYSINLPASGKSFGDSFKNFGCSGYTDFVFEANKQPATWAFEQGITNAYTVTKKATTTPTTACDLNFTANPTVIQIGSGTPSTTLSWNATTGSSGCQPATSCVAVNGWAAGSMSPVGTLPYTNFTNPVAGGSQTFTISCTYQNISKVAHATVTFQGQTNQNYCDPTLDASPNSVFPGSSVNISWSAVGTSNNCKAANYCLAQSDWATGQLQNQGNRSYTTQTGSTGSQTFAVKCYYDDGSVRQANDYITFQTITQNYGSPTIDASPSSVFPGDQISIVWSGGNGATSCYAVDGWAAGTLNPNGSRPYTTSAGAPAGSSESFQIRCSYPDGNSRDALDSIAFLNKPIAPCVTCVIPPNPYVNPGNGGTSGIAGSPIVRTLAARSIEKTSAKLRGYFNANGCPAISTWFEYSDDKSNLDRRSDDITQANKYGNVEFVATNLTANTKYYYRIVGENCKGLSLGAIESFRTARGGVYTEGGAVGTQTVKPVTVVKESVTKTTVVDTTIKTSGAGTSYLRLDVTNDNDIPDDNEPVHTVIRGEVVVYRVVWENLTTSMLHDGKIRVNLPKILSFMNSSNGIYDRDSHSVYMTIGDIVGRASGVEFITLQVGTNGQVGDAVIVEAIAAFDAPGSDAQVNATDFDEDVLADRNVAVAATPAFSGNWMWFVGGLLLLILVFLIARYHTLAGQYRQGGYMMPQHGGYQPAYAPAPVPHTPAREVDPFVPPSAVPRDESGPVYKPYVPNSL